MKVENSEKQFALVNPFALPTNDPDLYHQREIERGEEEKYRQAIKYYPIQERHVFTQAKSILPDLRREITDADGLPPVGSRRALSSKKETIKEFIQRKREILLVKKSIENKKAKYNELEEDLIKKEERHKGNIKKLEDNKGRVEKYQEQLKLDADSKAKQSEDKAAERAEKQKELKNLVDEIESLKAKVDRTRDELENLKDFKKFVEELVPSDVKLGFFLTEGMDSKKVYAKKLEEGINSLEATNLFRILQKQDDEHELEALKKRNNDKMNKEIHNFYELKSNVHDLEIAKKGLEEKLKRISMAEQFEAPIDQISSKKVHNELELLYKECGGDMTNNPKELEMLEMIEKVFDHQLKEKEQKNKEIVKKLERDIDKDRRTKKIEEERIKSIKKAELFNKKLEERKQKIAKKVGRKDMKRMKLHKKEKIETPPEEPQEVLDRREFLESED